MRSGFLTAVAVLSLSAYTFAAGREIAPRELAPSPYWAGSPQVAFAANRFLTTWIESKGDIGFAVMGALSDANGRLVSGRAFVIQPFHSEYRLVGAGNSFAFFSRRNDGTVHLSHLDARGNVMRTRLLELRFSYDVQISWNGERFLVVDGNSEGKAYLLDRSGSVVQADFLEPYVRRGDSIAPFDGGFTLVTNDFRGFHGQRISNDGTAGPRVLLETERKDVSRLTMVSVTTAGRGVLVVWTAHTLGSSHTEASRELRSVVLHADGSAGPVRVLATYPQNVFVKPLHLRRGGGLHLLTFAIEGYDGVPSQLFTLAVRSDGIAQPPLRTVAAYAPLPVLAAAGGPITLAVFRAPEPGRMSLQSIAVGSDGTPLRPVEDLAFALARQGHPVLARTSSRLLAAWDEDLGGEQSVRVASLRPDGTLLRSHTVAGSRLASRDLVWNDAEGVTLVRRGDRLHAAFVDLDGAPVASEPVPIGELVDLPAGRSSAVAWAGDRWLIAWAGRSGTLNMAIVRNRRLERVHTLVPATSLPTARRGFGDLTFARNAKHLILAWTERLSPICLTETPPCGDDVHRTYAAQVTADGVFASGPLEVASGSQTLSVATSGDELLLLADGKATILHGDARRILRTTTVFGHDVPGDVTWDGSSYLVAFRLRLVDWYLVVARLDREGNLIGELRGTRTLAADALRAPAITGSIVTLQEGDAADGARAVVYDERDLSVLPPRPRNPIPYIAPSQPGWVQVTWDAVPDAELYVVESDGGAPTWRRRHIIPADRLLRTEIQAGAIRVTAIGPGGASAPPPKQRSARQ